MIHKYKMNYDLKLGKPAVDQDRQESTSCLPSLKA